MKVFKKILIILLAIIGIALLLFIINYARIYISYLINKKSYIETFDVQGNTSKYVPQGLAYSEKYNIVMQTSYNKNHDVSMLYVTDFDSGKLLKSLKLIEIDGSNNINHVGGITTDESTVWITNDYEVNEYSLDEIFSTENDYIKSLRNEKLPNRGDFCLYDKGTLWIGDFFLNPFYKVPDDNPLLLGYSNMYTDKIDYKITFYVISLQKLVQCIEITSDHKFVFTGSFTYLHKSSLSIYDNVLNNEPDYYYLNGIQIPYYSFNESNLIKEIKLPPMAEGFFEKDNELYILFESSADSYSLAFPKLRKIIKYNF